MYRDLWTLLIPSIAVVAATLAIGLLLDFSDGALGWTILGAGGLTAAGWSATRPASTPADRR